MMMICDLPSLTDPNLLTYQNEIGKTLLTYFFQSPQSHAAFEFLFGATRLYREPYHRGSRSAAGGGQIRTMGLIEEISHCTALLLYLSCPVHQIAFGLHSQRGPSQISYTSRCLIATGLSKQTLILWKEFSLFAQTMRHRSIGTPSQQTFQTEDLSTIVGRYLKFILS